MVDLYTALKLIDYLHNDDEIVTLRYENDIYKMFRHLTVRQIKEENY